MNHQMYKAINASLKKSRWILCLYNWFFQLPWHKSTRVYLRIQHLRGIFSLHMILLHNCTNAAELQLLKSTFTKWNVKICCDFFSPFCHKPNNRLLERTISRLMMRIIISCSPTQTSSLSNKNKRRLPSVVWLSQFWRSESGSEPVHLEE